MKKRPDPELIDEENPEWRAADIARAIPFSELPQSLRDKLGTRARGPQKTPTKERITIRLSRDVLEQFRSTGDGWQTRVDTALKDWLETHSPT